jgi:hypothetical protein
VDQLGVDEVDQPEDFGVEEVQPVVVEAVQPGMEELVLQVGGGGGGAESDQTWAIAMTGKASTTRDWVESIIVLVRVLISLKILEDAELLEKSDY